MVNNEFNHIRLGMVKLAEKLYEKHTRPSKEILTATVRFLHQSQHTHICTADQIGVVVSELEGLIDQIH